jgi:hypothetical protein
MLRLSCRCSAFEVVSSLIESHGKGILTKVEKWLHTQKAHNSYVKGKSNSTKNSIVKV